VTVADETDNHGYKIPDEGETNWDEPLNETLRQLETDVEIRDGNGNRSNYDPKAGTKFLATDTGDVYLGDGNRWMPVDSTGPSAILESAYIEGGEHTNPLYAETDGVPDKVTVAIQGACWGEGTALYGYAPEPNSSALHAVGDARAENNRAIRAEGRVEVEWGDNTVLAIDHETGSLQFGSATDPLAGAPMLYMYEGGTENSRRPVAVHSPQFPGYGLFYEDANDKFTFENQGDRVHTVDLAKKRVGINEPYPTADFHVGGDVKVDGALQAETKNFVHSVDTPEGEREVTYTSVESDTPHTETTGVAELEDGRAEVELPDHFAWVTDAEEPLVVQVTPHARERVHPQVTERSTHRIVVEDFSDADEYEVSYTVTGTREGHADPDVVADPDTDPDVAADPDTDPDVAADPDATGDPAAE
jgi:hypothetical protein